jgi:hypothetical protein
MRLGSAKDLPSHWNVLDILESPFIDLVRQARGRQQDSIGEKMDPQLIGRFAGS